jgi:hypothetical protein
MRFWQICATIFVSQDFRKDTCFRENENIYFHEMEKGIVVSTSVPSHLVTRVLAAILTSVIT